MLCHWNYSKHDFFWILFYQHDKIVTQRTLLERKYMSHFFETLWIASYPFILHQKSKWWILWCSNLWLDVQNAPKMPFPPISLCTTQRYVVLMIKSLSSNAGSYSINPTYASHGPQRIFWCLLAQFSFHLTLLFPDLPQQVLSLKYQRQTRLGYPLWDGF